ncbi:MAG: hypothetical protein IPO99_18015 [Nitrospira sp.]|nr:hypothetical protein [Nitrospira sp.]
MLQASAENRPGLESDLAALIEEQTHRRQAAPVEEAPKSKVHPRPAASPTTPRPHRAEEHGHHEPPISLHEWLSGIGVPPAQPFVPDAWQVDALARLAETDVVVSVPTGSGKTYVAIEATKRAMQENRTVIYALIRHTKRSVPPGRIHAPERETDAPLPDRRNPVRSTAPPPS